MTIDFKAFLCVGLTVVIYVFTAICQLIFTWIYDDDNDDD